MRIFVVALLLAPSIAFYANWSAAAPRPQTQPDAVQPSTVAGRTLNEWAKDLKSSNQTVRLRAALSLGAFGPYALPVLVESLNDDDAAVRYWAASHIGDLGKKTPDAIPKLKEGIHDPNVGIQISSAYALCRLGHTEEGLPVLTRALKSKVLAEALSAIDFLQRIGPGAEAAIPALQEAMTVRDYHMSGAAKAAIAAIQETESDTTTPNLRKPKSPTRGAGK